MSKLKYLIPCLYVSMPYQTFSPYLNKNSSAGML